MKQTGHDLPSLYKETSEGGLAKDYDLAKRGLLKKGDNGNKKNKGKWEKYFAS